MYDYEKMKAEMFESDLNKMCGDSWEVVCCI